MALKEPKLKEGSKGTSKFLEDLCMGMTILFMYSVLWSLVVIFIIRLFEWLL